MCMHMRVRPCMCHTCHTQELAKKVGASEIIVRIVEDLKDESEPYRKMVMETVEKVR